MSRKLYPIGIQTFERIRKEDMLYVDKTEYVYHMTHTDGKYFFLSRPRRFGKSLLTSTFRSYFEGRRDLFKGLAIERLETEWTEYPVLHFSMAGGKHMDKDQLERYLDRRLAEYEEEWGIDIPAADANDRLSALIMTAFNKTERQVVVLVDEYDAPLLDVVHEDEKLPLLRNVMRNFYSPLKDCEPYLRFVFLTGITKFSQMSIFSELNNMVNVSMRNDYAGICGITNEELESQMSADVDALAARLGMTREDTLTRLREYYDGYHFAAQSPDVYNPFSLLNAMASGCLDYYWFSTGTPTYLVKLLQKHHYDLERMTHEETDAQVLNSIDSESTNPIPVIYQSGYLTIKGYDEEFGMYRLGFPNREVEEGFVRFLLPYYANVNKVESPFEIQKFVREVRSGDYSSFFRRLQSFFADTTYEVIRDQELHYENVLFIVFKLVGFYAKVEYHTSEGRIDLVLQTDKFIYIMEFKLNGTAEEALRQIEDKHYARPFATDSRKLFKIGVNFSVETRNIEKWLVEN